MTTREDLPPPFTPGSRSADILVSARLPIPGGPAFRAPAVSEPCPDCEGHGALRSVPGYRVSPLDRFAEPDEAIPCPPDHPDAVECEPCAGTGRVPGPGACTSCAVSADGEDRIVPATVGGLCDECAQNQPDPLTL